MVVFRVEKINIHEIEFVIVTTAIGCPINCIEYCPQEVWKKIYKGNRSLSLENFKVLLSQIPKNVAINFAGLSEPFTNPDCTNMIIYAHQQGYKIVLYSTFLGATLEDIDRIKKIPFIRVMVHLPDGKQFIAKNPKHWEVLMYAIQNIRTCEFITMNALFETCGYENYARGMRGKPRRVQYCQRLKIPQTMLLPNGDLLTCCQDCLFEGNLGNLFKENYNTLVAKITKFERCKYCEANISWAKAIIRKMFKGVRKFFT